MDEVVTASPGEDSPLLNTEAGLLGTAAADQQRSVAVEGISVNAERYPDGTVRVSAGSDRKEPGANAVIVHPVGYPCRDAVHTWILYREKMMDIFTYVSIASQFMIFGAVCECIAILTGYVVYTVFSIMEGGR